MKVVKVVQRAVVWAVLLPVMAVVTVTGLLLLATKELVEALLKLGEAVLEAIAKVLGIEK